MATKTVLDATCGPKHIWHQASKDRPEVVYTDRRQTDRGEITERQPGAVVSPDLLADTRALPFPDRHFDLVCYDPPHRVTSDGMERLSGVVTRKYGALQAETWQDDLRRSFSELWRVLDSGGTLTLKWADVHKDAGSVLSLAPADPLYGHRFGKGDSDTTWWVFHKPRGVEVP